MKTVLSILIIFHGLIHLAGFSKAFNLEATGYPIQFIPKVNGILWLVAALLVIISGFLFFFSKNSWWVISLVAIIFSQYLVCTSWPDSKAATVVNVVILIAIMGEIGLQAFNNKYNREVVRYLKQSAPARDGIITEFDIMNLPGPIKKYLHYTGVVGSPYVRNFKVEFSGQIRKNEKWDWMPFTSQQYNFIEGGVRLFFMKTTMKYLPVAGFHCFKHGKAFMDIRLLLLFKVQYQGGREMDISETVTFFNDMCCMAPATLIDKRIQWQEDGKNKVRAQFTINNITIAASLYFNDKGELINFISDDRYAAAGNQAMKRLRWSTPMKEFKIFGRYKLAGHAETIYNYPEGKVCYGNFRLTNVEYNCI